MAPLFLRKESFEVNVEKKSGLSEISGNSILLWGVFPGNSWK